MLITDQQDLRTIQIERIDAQAHDNPTLHLVTLADNKLSFVNQPIPLAHSENPSWIRFVLRIAENYVFALRWNNHSKGEVIFCLIHQGNPYQWTSEETTITYLKTGKLNTAKESTLAIKELELPSTAGDLFETLFTDSEYYKTAGRIARRRRIGTKYILQKSEEAAQKLLQEIADELSGNLGDTDIEDDQLSYYILQTQELLFMPEYINTIHEAFIAYMDGNIELMLEKLREAKEIEDEHRWPPKHTVS